MAKTKFKKKDELKPFKSSQEVNASKIISVAKGREGSATLVVEGKTASSNERVVEVDKHYVKKHNPRSGNYFTVETVTTKDAEDKEVQKDVYGYIDAETFEKYFSEVK